MTAEAFLDRVRASRAAFDAVLARVPADRWLEPGVHEGWSVKDVVAHVTWFEAQQVELLGARALVGSELWALPAHERNDAIWRATRDLTVDAVRAESARVQAELVTLLEGLDDQDLVDPSRFRDMPPDWEPGDVLAQNTHEHYDAHREVLEAWLEASSPEA